MCSHWLSQACWQVATMKPAADLLQAWWSQQPCLKSCSNNLLSGCKSTTWQQVVSHKLGTTWQNNSIATNLLQACCEHNLLTTCAFLRVYTPVCHQAVATFIRAACSQLLQQVIDKLLSTWWRLQTCYKFVPRSLIPSGYRLETSCFELVVIKPC